MKKTIQLMAVLIAGGFMASTCAWGQVNYATPYTFITIAGTPGDYGSANGLNGAGLFEFPEGTVVDTNDNLYVVDSGADIVVKVSPAGGTNWQVTGIAGDPDNPGSQDGNNQGATFSEPGGIAMDSSNNLYVADTGNSILRKMTKSGPNWMVATIAGTPSFFGGGADGTNGAAQFSDPSGITVNAAGTLYVADTDNDTIRMVVPMGTNWVVTTIAGTVGAHGSTDGTNLDAQFYAPSSIVIDHVGNLFVADSGNNTIREMVPVGTNWVVSTIAGTAGTTGYTDGTNTDAQFDYPAALAVDANDNIFVADTLNNTIREITPVGTNWVTTTLAGVPQTNGTNNGTGSNALFYGPFGIAVDTAGNVFVGDTSNATIRQGFVAAVPNPVISLTAGGSVMVSWHGPGGTLQTNADLTTANWGVYGGTVTSSNGTNSVTLPPSGGSLYFRLTN